MRAATAIYFSGSQHAKTKSLCGVKVSELQLNLAEGEKKKNNGPIRIGIGNLGRLKNKSWVKIANKDKVNHINNNKNNEKSLIKEEMKMMIELSIENFKNKIFRKKRKANEISKFEDDILIKHSNVKLPAVFSEQKAPMNGSSILLMIRDRNKLRRDNSSIGNVPKLEQREGNTPTPGNVNEDTAGKNLNKILIVYPKFSNVNELCGGQFKWKRGEKIHTGENSLIYKAFNILTGNIFIVKEYNCTLGRCLEYYNNEVIFLSAVNHANIVKYMGSEFCENYGYVYLEYASGGSILQLISNYGVLREKIIIIYLKQVIAGLEYLHHMGYEHNNIKSSNVLIDSDGNIQISDFAKCKLETGLRSDFAGVLNLIKEMYTGNNNKNSFNCLIHQLANPQLKDFVQLLSTHDRPITFQEVLHHNFLQ